MRKFLEWRHRLCDLSATTASLFSYIPEKVRSEYHCSFLASKSFFFNGQKQYVILGVTGPNEYKKTSSTNFYTTCICKMVY
jgi:hypothetical protein